MRDVQREMIHACRSAGDWDGMRANAEFLLTFDPLDEHAMLAVVEALGLAGERTQALKRYTDFERRLREELEAEPGVELRSWASNQRRNQVQVANGAPGKQEASRVCDTLVIPTVQPVFGRQEEYADLWHGWESSLKGRGQFVIVRGEAGIGKTALVTKLATQVHVSGGSVSFVRCYRSEKAVPFAPVSTLIRQISRLPGFVATSEVWIGELTRVVPELRERFPQIPQPLPIDDSARHRLCDATIQAAQCVADEHPLLVVVDDIQDADEATLALLHYFGRQLGQNPVFLLCLARSDSRPSDLQRVFFETVQSQRFGRFLDIGGLHEDAIRRLIAHVMAQRGITLDPWAISKLAVAAGGNPLRCIEATLAVPDRQSLTADQWADALKRHFGSEESFEETVSERFSRLSQDARLVLRLLLIAGRPIDEYALQGVSSLATTEFASATGELEVAHFLTRRGAVLVIAHERYLTTLIPRITREEQLEAHKRLAEHLLSTGPDNPALRYEIAVHFEGAGLRAQAYKQALAAADFASSVGAAREQAKALELARRVASPTHMLTAQLAYCYLSLKDFARTRTLCAEVAQDSTVDASLSAEFDYLRIAADYFAGRRSFTDLLAELQQVLARSVAFRSEGDARALLLKLADKSGAHSIARRSARTLRRLARTDERQHLASFASYATGVIRAKYYWPSRALPYLREALRMAQEEKKWSLEHLCREALGAVLKQLGRYHESVDEINFSLALARRTLDPLTEAMALNNLAVTQMALGQFDGASANLDRCTAVIGSHPSWPLGCYCAYNRAVLHLLRRELDRAHDSFALAREIADRGDVWPVSVYSEAGLSLCSLMSGRFSEFEEHAETVRVRTRNRKHLLTDRWMVETTYAWNELLSRSTPDRALQLLADAAANLQDRDVDNWLRLRLERIRLKEHITGSVADSDRAELLQDARRFSAEAIARDAVG
jgi:tetratricopeptide (TPR) repeat protein